MAAPVALAAAAPQALGTGALGLAVAALAWLRPASRCSSGCCRGRA